VKVACFGRKGEKPTFLKYIEDIICVIVLCILRKNLGIVIYKELFRYFMGYCRNTFLIKVIKKRNIEV